MINHWTTYHYILLRDFFTCIRTLCAVLHQQLTDVTWTSSRLWYYCNPAVTSTAVSINHKGIWPCTTTGILHLSYVVFMMLRSDRQGHPAWSLTSPSVQLSHVACQFKTRHLLVTYILQTRVADGLHTWQQPQPLGRGRGCGLWGGRPGVEPLQSRLLDGGALQPSPDQNTVVSGLVAALTSRTAQVAQCVLQSVF